MRLLPAWTLLAAAGLGLGIYAVMSPSYLQPPALRAPPSTVTKPLTPSVSRPVEPPVRVLTTSAKVVSPPARIAVPAIGISSVLGPSRGLKADGSIDDAPLSGPTWSLPWWYNRGSAPGQKGSTVILGHVDSALGAGHLGAFYRLRNARVGDHVSVTLADRSVTRWIVTSVRQYSDGAFPGALVYGRSGPPTLRLVTCGGVFNWQTHHYESALVVTARLVSL